MSVSLPVRKVPFHQCSIGQAEMDAVQAAMESNSGSSVFASASTVMKALATSAVSRIRRT